PTRRSSVLIHPLARRASSSLDCSRRPRRAKSARPPRPSFIRALDGHRRAWSRPPLAHPLRRARLVNRLRLRRLRLRPHRPHTGNAGGLPWWLVRWRDQPAAHQRLSLFSGNSARDCLCGLLRSRHRQGDSRAHHHRLAGYARLARAQVLKVKELEFILAAQSLGASRLRILLRHLLPNIVQPVLIQAAIGIAGAILAESTLSFLGLGVLAPVPSSGSMLNDARGHLFDAPHMVVFPALAVMVAVLSFNLLGDAWRDWLDPRTRAELEVAHLPR